MPLKKEILLISKRKLKQKKIELQKNDIKEFCVQCKICYKKKDKQKNKIRFDLVSIPNVWRQNLTGIIAF